MYVLLFLRNKDIYIYIYIKRRVVVAITCTFDLFDHCTVNGTTAELTVQYYREDESIVMRMMMMTMRVVHTRR